MLDCQKKICIEADFLSSESPNWVTDISECSLELPSSQNQSRSFHRDYLRRSEPRDNHSKLWIAGAALTALNWRSRVAQGIFALASSNLITGCSDQGAGSADEDLLSGLDVKVGPEITLNQSLFPSKIAEHSLASFAGGTFSVALADDPSVLQGLIFYANARENILNLSASKSILHPQLAQNSVGDLLLSTARFNGVNGNALLDLDLTLHRIDRENAAVISSSELYPEEDSDVQIKKDFISLNDGTFLHAFFRGQGEFILQHLDQNMAILAESNLDLSDLRSISLSPSTGNSWVMALALGQEGSAGKIEIYHGSAATPQHVNTLDRSANEVKISAFHDLWSTMLVYRNKGELEALVLKDNGQIKNDHIEINLAGNLDSFDLGNRSGKYFVLGLSSGEQVHGILFNPLGVQLELGATLENLGDFSGKNTDLQLEVNSGGSVIFQYVNLNQGQATLRQRSIEISF